MRLRTNLAFWALPIVFLLAILLFAKRNKFANVSVSPEEQAILSKWNSHPYVPPETDESSLRHRSDQLPIISSNYTLHPMQSAELREAGFRFVRSFSTNDFEAYSAFMFPTNTGKFENGILDFRLSRLRIMKFKNAEKLSADDGREIIKLWWELWTGDVNRSKMKDERDALKSDVIKEISWEPSGWHLIQTNHVPHLGTFMMAHDTVGIFSQRHPFNFEPPPTSMLGRAGFVQSAMLQIYIGNKHDPRMPVYVQFYWNDHQWLPVSLGLPYSFKRQRGFLF